MFTWQLDDSKSFERNECTRITLVSVNVQSPIWRSGTRIFSPKLNWVQGRILSTTGKGSSVLNADCSRWCVACLQMVCYTWRNRKCLLVAVCVCIFNPVPCFREDSCVQILYFFQVKNRTTLFVWDNAWSVSCGVLIFGFFVFSSLACHCWKDVFAGSLRLVDGPKTEWQKDCLLIECVFPGWLQRGVLFLSFLSVWSAICYHWIRLVHCWVFFSSFLCRLLFWTPLTLSASLN
jgi:hypothetical protein